MRYDELSVVSRHAHALEENGQMDEAHAKFLQLRSSAGSGYFRMVAEAGLFRLSGRSTSGA